LLDYPLKIPTLVNELHFAQLCELDQAMAEYEEQKRLSLAYQVYICETTIRLCKFNEPNECALVQLLLQHQPNEQAPQLVTAEQLTERAKYCIEELIRWKDSDNEYDDNMHKNLWTQKLLKYSNK